MPTADELRILQALPLEMKVARTKQRLREFMEQTDAFVAFSGGKDSTVLAHLMFGACFRGDKRFIQLAKIDPRQYEFAFGGGQWVDNPKYDPAAPKYDGEWKNWNPKKIWVPSKKGLGLQYVIDEFNALYPKNKIQY